MPFQNLRVNSEFFVLHKDGAPYIEVGSVVGVSNPVPEFMQQPIPYGQPPKMVVDITIKVGEQTVTFQKIPAMSDIADANFPGGGNMVISGSRESMNAEVAAIDGIKDDIILDFSGVIFVSRSFTDELYNVMAENKNVSLVNMSKFVKSMLEAVTDGRNSKRVFKQSESEIKEFEDMGSLSSFLATI